MLEHKVVTASCADFVTGPDVHLRGSPSSQSRRIICLHVCISLPPYEHSSWLSDGVSTS